MLLPRQELETRNGSGQDRAVKAGSGPAGCEVETSRRYSKRDARGAFWRRTATDDREDSDGAPQAGRKIAEKTMMERQLRFLSSPSRVAVGRRAAEHSPAGTRRLGCLVAIASTSIRLDQGLRWSRRLRAFGD